MELQKNLTAKVQTNNIQTPQLQKNNLDFESLAKQQNWSQLKLARFEIAKLSIKKAMIRVQKQKIFDVSFDQIDKQELFDQKVSQNINYQEYSVHFAGESTVNKGRFSSCGNFYGTVDSVGDAWVWNANPDNKKDFTNKITSLKTDVKLCDIAYHPQVGKIPAFAPNICTSSSNGELLFWTFDPKLEKQKSFKLKPHSERINSIDYHESGKYLLCNSYDTTWSFFDSSRLKQIYVQKGHQKEIHTGCLHPDGSLYFTGDMAGCGQIWDLRTGQGIYEIKQSDSILCSDFKSNGYQLAVGGKSNIITIKDLRRMKNIKQIPAHTKLISGLKYAKDQSVLCSVSHDNQLKLWHGLSYTNVTLENLIHNSKVTSIDTCEGRIATTTIQRKWVMWLLKRNQYLTKIQEESSSEVQEQKGAQQEF